MKIILASASPRRKELLSMLGMDFEIIPSQKEEIMPAGLSPEETVMQLARSKCNEVRELLREGEKDAVIISADTIVWIDGKILGKPSGEKEAFEMLSALSGRTHSVYTGICVNSAVSFEKSEVRFAQLSEEEIRAYIATREPMDKAGAYGIQGLGGMFIEHIDGDYFNIMGLPIHRLYLMLKEQGVNLI